MKRGEGGGKGMGRNYHLLLALAVYDNLAVGSNVRIDVFRRQALAALRLGGWRESDA